MAILPRCALSGQAAASTISPPLTGWTNSGAGVSGTAPAAGDFVVLVITDNTAAGTVSQTAGTGWSTLVGPTVQNVSNGNTQSWVLYRLWTGSETAPTWTYASGGNRVAWAVAAFAPDAGYTLVIDVQATEKLDTSPSTSHTPPAVTGSAAYSGETSVIPMVASTSTQGTNTVNYTAPASYTTVAAVSNTGAAGTYGFAAGIFYRSGVSGTVTPGAATAQGGGTAGGTTNAVIDHFLLAEYLPVALADRAGAVESMPVPPVGISLADRAAAADAITYSYSALIQSITYGDVGAAEDDDPLALTYAESQVNPLAEGGGAADGLIVAKLPVPTPVPGLVARIASPAFIVSRMPRMHVQNLLTGKWLHRDVQGVESPSITWQLNAPDQFTCNLGPPRPDLMDASGNPLLAEWRDACYLEENDEIKFGGILTSSSFAGPVWSATFTGFMGYPAGTPYEGPDYSKTYIDALDVVRYLWAWLQGQPNASLGLDPDATDSGTLLGSDVPAGAKSTLNGYSKAGSTVIKVHDASPFNPKMKVSLAGGSAHIVKSTSPSANTVTLTTPTANPHNDGATIAQVMSATPYQLFWYNSTDIGQEIGNIQTEVPFDQWETHSWTGQDKAGVRHRLHFGVPRAGQRQSTLRFAEGENIVEAVQGTRDGSAYANAVVGLGSGQGKKQIRKTVANVDGHLRRVLVYTDQTIKTDARMQSRAQRILASRIAIDTPTTVVIKNHPNAPFGSFVPGDDIYVQWVTGWRNTGIWGRITQMTQDPTTDLMTLTLARSDSFTYLAQPGQAGTQ